MSDEPDSPDGRTEQLIRLKAELADDFAALTQNTNSIYNHHLDLLEQLRERKLASLDQWCENEKVSIQRHCDGQYYAIDNDVEERARLVETRVSDFLAFKLQLLKEKFPDAAKYFACQGYEDPVRSSARPPPLHLTPQVDIQPTNEPLISVSDIQADLKLVSKLMNHPTNPHALTNGLRPRQPALLRIGHLPPISGALGDFGDGFVEFVTERGQTYKVKLMALELGHASIEVQ
jgi:hypothetical protein